MRNKEAENPVDYRYFGQDVERIKTRRFIKLKIDPAPASSSAEL
jgi:hypothetical protein